MIRVLILVCAALLYTLPARAQQTPPERSEQDQLLELMRSMQGKLTIEGECWVFVDRVDMPIPGQRGSRIFADEVRYCLDTRILLASGNVNFSGGEGRISAERVEFRTADGTATFYEAAGIVTLPDADRAAFGNQEPAVYFWGDRIDKQGPRKYRIEDGGFSACVQPTPRWEVSSDVITLNLDDYALARGTVLRVKGVPLLYLPILYYPLQEDQRSTGFLMPSYGTSDLRGGSLSNAFFWALGRSQDATFFHDWFTRTGSGVGAEYRYVSGVMSSGDVRFYRFTQDETRFDNDGSSQILPAKTSYQVNASVYQDIGRLRAQGNVEYFTDVETQQLYHQNAYQRTQSRRTVAGGVTGVFGATTLAGYFQHSEQFLDTRNSVVQGSQPRATASVAPSRLFGTPVYASLNSEFIFQPNRRLRDGIVTTDESLARFDVAPALRVPLSRLTFLSVNTNVAYRSTYFSRSLDEKKQLTDQDLTRQYVSLETDIVGPVLAKIWDTPGSGYSERMKHVIEPTFGVEYISEIKNQQMVPVSDSSAMAVGGAMKFTYGVTNRLFARTPETADGPGSTREFVTIGLQQTYYTDPESSRYDSTYASYSLRPRLVDLSPIALTARIAPTAALDANARIEYDVTGNGFQIFTAGGTLSSSAYSANVSFSRQRATPASSVSSYLSASTSMRFMQGRTSAFYGVNWDIDASYLYSQSLGGAYLAQCCGIQADFQVVNFPPALRSPIPQDRRFNVAFVLAGLGTFSNFFGLFGGQQ